MTGYCYLNGGEPVLKSAVFTTKQPEHAPTMTVKSIKPLSPTLLEVKYAMLRVVNVEKEGDRVNVSELFGNSGHLTRLQWANAPDSAARWSWDLDSVGTMFDSPSYLTYHNGAMHAEDYLKRATGLHLTWFDEANAVTLGPFPKGKAVLRGIFVNWLRHAPTLDDGGVGMYPEDMRVQDLYCVWCQAADNAGETRVDLLVRDHIASEPAVEVAVRE